MLSGCPPPRPGLPGHDGDLCPACSYSTGAHAGHAALPTPRVPQPTRARWPRTRNPLWFLSRVCRAASDRGLSGSCRPLRTEPAPETPQHRNPTPSCPALRAAPTPSHRVRPVELSLLSCLGHPHTLQGHAGAQAVPAAVLGPRCPRSGSGRRNSGLRAALCGGRATGHSEGPLSSSRQAGAPTRGCVGHGSAPGHPGPREW